MNPFHDFSKSWALVDRARKLIPMGTGTNTKAARLRDRQPAYMVRGEGGRLWDVDGHEYLDFHASLGPMTLGYNHPVVREAMEKQMRDGWLFSKPHPLEVEVAQALVETVPAAQRVRYLKTGAEAMAAAIKLARAYTGRDVVVTCGYHGWIQTMSNQPGVPQAISDLMPGVSYGDIDAARQAVEPHRGQIAAFCITGDYRRMAPDDPFPQQYAQLARDHGALLITDEMVTGYRLAQGGFHEYFDLQPDLAVFGKGIANGMPITVYLGRADVMAMAERGAIISSTFSGEVLSLAAAKATMEVYRREPVIEHLWSLGTKMRDGLAALFERHGLPITVPGLPPCPRLTFAVDRPGQEAQLRESWLAHAARYGVLLNSAVYVNHSHTDADIDQALQRLDEAARSWDPKELPTLELSNTPAIGAAADQPNR